MSQIRKPRAPTQYSNVAHGARFDNKPPDDMTINPSFPNVTLLRPGKERGVLVVRPLPCLSEENPDQIMPGRHSASNHAQRQWITKADVAKYVGLPDCPKSTFILYTPHEAKANPALRLNSPYVVLFRACKAAMKAAEFGPNMAWDSHWNKLMPQIGGGSGGGPSIPAPTMIGCFQAQVYCAGKKDYITAEHPRAFGSMEADGTVVVQVSGSLYSDIVDLLDTEKSDEQLVRLGDFDEEALPWKKYVFGDATGVPAMNAVTGGVIMSIFYPDQASIQDDPATGNQIVHLSNRQSFRLDRTTWNGEAQPIPAFQAAFSPSYVSNSGLKFTADLDEAAVAAVKANWQFWWDDPETDQPGLLQVKSVSEQAVLIAISLSRVPNLLRFAWADHPEFLTPEVEKILNAARSVVMPGLPSEQAAARSREVQTDPVSRRTIQAPAAGNFDEEFQDDPGTNGENVAQPAEAIQGVADEFMDEAGETEPEQPVELAGTTDAGDTGEVGADFTDGDEPGATLQDTDTGEFTDDSPATVAEPYQEEFGDGAPEEATTASAAVPQAQSPAVKVAQATANTTQGINAARARSQQRNIAPPADLDETPVKPPPAPPGPTSQRQQPQTQARPAAQAATQAAPTTQKATAAPQAPATRQAAPVGRPAATGKPVTAGKPTVKPAAAPVGRPAGKPQPRKGGK